MAREEQIKRARPNGHYIELLMYRHQDHQDDQAYISYIVREPGDEGYEPWDSDFDTLSEAEEYFASRVKELIQIPNWEMQARYDEEHGTDNGYDPRIEQHRREQ